MAILIRQGPTRRTANRLTWSIFLGLLLVVSLAAAQPGESTSRRDGQAFASPLVIEVVPLDDPAASRQALADALFELESLERLLSTEDAAALGPEVSLGPGGIHAINVAAGQGPVTVDRRVLAVLARALEFCQWSRGAHGPLGGMLNGLWGLRRSVGGLPSAPVVSEQAALTACHRLTLDPERRSATLEAGSRIDLWGFERGFAVDQTAQLLIERGFASGWVRIGQVSRAFGPGGVGSGWPVAVDPLDPGLVPTERLYLHDRALAMASPRERVLEIGGERLAPYIDHRSGQPASGKSAVLVVAEEALDAEALATALFVMSSREGEFRLGTLRPQPAVKWFLGDGEGQPLIMMRGWSRLETWKGPD